MKAKATWKEAGIMFNEACNRTVKALGNFVNAVNSLSENDSKKL